MDSGLLASLGPGMTEVIGRIQYQTRLMFPYNTIVL
jgi:hypothetical protein